MKLMLHLKILRPIRPERYTELILHKITDPQNMDLIK